MEEGMGAISSPCCVLSRMIHSSTARIFPMFISDYVLLQQRIPKGGQMRPPFVFSSGLLAEDGLPF